jgi:hypothetical protein
MTKKPPVKFPATSAVITPATTTAKIAKPAAEPDSHDESAARRAETEKRTKELMAQRDAHAAKARAARQAEFEKARKAAAAEAQESDAP